MISKHCKKEEVLKAFGSTKDVCRFFKISRAAVSAWADGEPIPLARQNELRLRRPKLFRTSLAEDGWD